MLAKTGVRPEYASLNRFDTAYSKNLTAFSIDGAYTPQALALFPKSPVLASLSAK